MDSSRCDETDLEAHVVEEDLLDNESGHGLGQLRPGLHDPQAQRDDLRRQQEVNHLPTGFQPPVSAPA
jgi:hypothetical protein